MLQTDSLLGKKFDLVLFVMPGELPGIDRDERFWMDTLDKDWLWGQLTKLSQLAVEANYKAKALLVFDDILTEIERSGNDKDIENLIYRRRWLFPNVEVSMVIAAQYFNLVPRRFRFCYTHIMMFNLPPGEFTAVSKNYTYIKMNDVKYQQMELHLRKKHNFIVIHLDDGLVFLNFFKVI
jgi:hypothetical protein